MRFRRDTPVTTLIIAINIAVFIMWKGWLPANWGITPAFMESHFLVSYASLTGGRPWTLLGSAFSHLWPLHLLVNMFVLNSFGRFLESFLGARFYLAFYLVAGIVGSLCHALVSNFILGQPDLPALGASGAIAGLVLLFSLIYPKEKIVLFAIIPVPALVGALAFVVLDLWGVIAQAEGGGLPIGHGAHLGGSLTGLLTYFLVVKPRLRTVDPLRAE